MDCYKLFGFVEILRESIKILPKNGKLMSFIATLLLLLYSIFFFLNIFSIKPLVYDMLIKEMNLPSTSPNTPQFTNLLHGIKEDVGIFLGIELAFFLAYLVVSLFTNTSTILVSALSYSGKKLSVKDLVYRVGESWIRLFFTSFHVTLLSIGYTFVFALAILIPPLMVSEYPIASKSIFIVLLVLALVFYIHLSVVWVLAFVISVIEEKCYGIEAIGKAGRLIKGKRLHGFILNFILHLVPMIINRIFRTITVKEWPTHHMLLGLCMVWSICLVTMFQFVAYTVLYFQCKKNHGEEIELQGSMEYSKIPTTPLAYEDIP